MSIQSLVTVAIKNEEENTFDNLSFQIDNDGYIQMSIDNIMMDTLEDLGKIETPNQLHEKVKYLLNCWEVEHKEITIA
ncbi:hypothetical protein [Psychrobacillus phage Perkons]|nr:hypothetical protein [Psychrobacillus phage Perkons]